MSDEQKTPEQIAAEEAAKAAEEQAKADEAAKAADEAAKAAEAEKNKERSKKVTLKGVVLNGTETQKEGVHTLHIGKEVIRFVDGKAQVTSDLAKRLVKDGLVEEVGE